MAKKTKKKPQPQPKVASPITGVTCIQTSGGKVTCIGVKAEEKKEGE